MKKMFILFSMLMVFFVGCATAPTPLVTTVQKKCDLQLATTAIVAAKSEAHIKKAVVDYAEQVLQCNAVSSTHHDTLVNAIDHNLYLLHNEAIIDYFFLTSPSKEFQPGSCNDLVDFSKRVREMQLLAIACDNKLFAKELKKRLVRATESIRKMRVTELCPKQ